MGVVKKHDTGVLVIWGEKFDEGQVKRHVDEDRLGDFRGRGVRKGGVAVNVDLPKLPDRPEWNGIEINDQRHLSLRDFC